MHELFYAAPGGRIRYLHHPNPGRPTLLGLHGFKDGAETFLGLDPLLSENFEVYLPDWAGHGGSYRLEQGVYSAANLFADLIAFTSELPQPFVLLGHSLGAAMAARFAGMFPDAVRSLVLLEGFAGLVAPSTEADRITAWATHFQRSWRSAQTEGPARNRNLGSRARARAALQRIHGRLKAEQLDQMTQDLTVETEQGVFWTHDDAINWRFFPLSFPPLISRALWSRVVCPVLLLYGEGTNLRPTTSGANSTGIDQSTLQHRPEERIFRGPDQPDPPLREIIDHFKDLEFHEVKAAGHNFHREQPEVVVSTMKGFFERTGLL